ncbi:MAG TPA: hypothetical protein ENH80_13025 [Phycisphaerae bacterium]|nr:hypothetical protein [Phycisphaerae bacterium]HDZ44850.1 hypothetical protein [Phycisphaerae bacterium]
MLSLLALGGAAMLQRRRS